MVGDSAKDDVVMAHRAGALGSVLLDSGRTRLLVPIGELKGEQRPTFVVRSLEARSGAQRSERRRHTSHIARRSALSLACRARRRRSAL